MNKCLVISNKSEKNAETGPPAGKKFIQLYEGDGLIIGPESEKFNFKCCNCGMIHKITIDHEEDYIILRFWEYTDKI